MRDKGLQFTFEGGGYLPAGDVTSGGFGAWIFTYKANPHLSYGLGFRAGGTDTDAQMESKTVVLSTGKEYFHTEEDISFSGPDVFLRGQYRLNDKRLSPFASCNLGIRFNADDHGGYLANEIVEKVGDYDKSVLYISPALGLSLRTTHNSYLELKIGYELSPSLKGKTLEETTNKEVNTWTRKGVSLSAPFVMLGFTHTTGLFSK